MKAILVSICLLVSLLTYAQTDSEELVIEMYEAPAVKTQPAALSIWDKDTAQLIRALRGKTREQALYLIENVSSKDRILRAGKNSFAVVEYIQKNDFRKLLFQAKDPQTFITAASTVADVLAINKKYGLKLSVAQTAFEQAYASQYTVENEPALPVYIVLYSLSYTDVNTPKAQPLWLLFDNKILTEIFYTSEEKDNYLQRFQTQPTTPTPAPAKQVKKPTLHKALISGGTTQDQMYMPKLVYPKPQNTTLPPLTPEKESF